MRLAPTLSSFLRRRVAVSYWLILLVIIIQILFYYRTRPINLGALAHARLASLQATFETTGGLNTARDDWGLQLGTTSLTSYIVELKEAWALLFGDGGDPSRSSGFGQRHPVPWKQIARRLSLDADPSPDFKSSIPHRVYTTSAVEPQHYPWQFKYWAENDPSLSFRHLNDSTVDEYLYAMYPPGTVMSQLLHSLNDGSNKRKSRVIKADIFRYTILLHKGGIYTDSDTAAVKKFDEWGNDYLDMTDQVIAQIPRAIHGDASFIASLSQSVPVPPPALIVAIEKSSDASWRYRSMARGLQVIQWTVAAQPGHPVFLDVLNRIVERWADELAEHPHKRAWNTADDVEVLDWTGPGPWSDAVIRYILARHGLDPRTLVGRGTRVTAPIRIGDVLVLPERAFQADASEKDSILNNDQACVWHGFLGSWKDEIKEEEEKEVQKDDRAAAAAAGRD